VGSIACSISRYILHTSIIYDDIRRPDDIQVRGEQQLPVDPQKVLRCSLSPKLLVNPKS